LGKKDNINLGEVSYFVDMYSTEQTRRIDNTSTNAIIHMTLNLRLFN
jgi:hypothetical protein